MREIILQSDGKGGHPISEVTGYSIPSIHRLERAGQFPARVQLGAAKVGWIRQDVEAWLAARVRGPLPKRQALGAAARGKAA